MRIAIEDGKLVAYPEGKLDSTNSEATWEALEAALAADPGRELEIDAEGLSYISSAGLRVIKRIKGIQGGLTIRNTSQQIHEILEMTGFCHLVNVKRKLREISVDGCGIVGRGAVGTVYRLDEDTIVKVYEIPDSLPMIENEQRRAKQAFLKGIPTAISFDVVKVGDRYGSVFEMIKAMNYNDLIIAHPEDREAIIRQYARFLRQLHEVEMARGELPDAREMFLEYLEKLQEILPKALYARLRALFEAMPENLHVIHGDIQMKNVMLSGDEPLLIDMDTLSVGDPVFDLMSVYVAYIQFVKEEPDNCLDFFGIDARVCEEIWEGTMRGYFDDLDESERRAEEDKVIAVALVRFLYLVAVLNLGKPELRQLRVQNALAQLEALAPKLTTLAVGSRSAPVDMGGWTNEEKPSHNGL